MYESVRGKLSDFAVIAGVNCCGDGRNWKLPLRLRIECERGHTVV
jgi:hypothetical protein